MEILVDQTKCSFIHRQLSKTWTTITAKIPIEMLNNAPSSFSVPAISSKRAREYQDGDSDDDSYGSLLSTGTTVSVMTTDDPLLNELPEEFRHPTYASAAASSMRSGTETQYSSPTASTNMEWQREKQLLEQQIREQASQIERIQVELQTKISRSKDLEDQLAQAIELAHTRDARHEEMLQKFEQLLSLYTQESLPRQNDPDDDDHDQSTPQTRTDPDQSTTMPTTPERLQEVGPPAKKANQNASPHRNIYSIFRKQQLRQIPPKNRKHKTAIQPMETDEDNRQLVLGAKPSNPNQE